MCENGGIILAEQRITIEIDEDGKISAKTSGFKGETCLEALQELLEEQLSPATFKPTDDYYQQTTAKSQQKQSMGRK
jgi:hypothetical protein